MNLAGLPDARPRKLGLFVLLSVALALRLAWVLTQPTIGEVIDRLPDQREYLALGKNLLQGRGLTLYDPRFGQEVVAFRTPGYPALVAACGGNVVVIRVVQAFLDTSTVLAVYLLARRWLAGGPALVAGGVVALNPFLIYFCGLVLTETLYTAMLAWGMWLLVGRGEEGRQGEGESTRQGEQHSTPPTPHAALAVSSSDATTSWHSTLRWLLGGLILAMSVLVRQSAIGLPVLLGVGAALVNRGAGVPYHRRWPLPVGTTLLGLTLIVLLPWGWRNYRLLGEWVWTSTNGGITLYDGLNPDATGASDQSFEAAMPELRTMGELERSAYLSDLAKQFARKHKWRVVELAAAKAGRMWSPVPLSQEYRGAKYWTVGLAYTIPLYFAAFLGVSRRSALPRAAKVFLLIPAIYFTAVHMLTVGSLRYRIPVEPPMAVLAASAVVLPAAGWKRSAWVRSGFPVVGRGSGASSTESE